MVPAPAPRVDGMGLVADDFQDYDDFMISADGVLTFKSPRTMRCQLVVARTARLQHLQRRGDGLRRRPRRDWSQDGVPQGQVTVTDEDENGMVTLSAQQPQVGVALKATLTDQDARSVAEMPIINAEWTWERAPAMDGPWTLIPGASASPGPTPATENGKAMDGYTPTKETDSNYLRATVTYTDKHGDDKPAMAVSARAVRAKPAGMNSTPVFPVGANARNVKENSPPGTNVGKPVAAGDAGDILTYTLTETDDNSNYRIDRATGQITVGPLCDAEP